MPVMPALVQMMTDDNVQRVAAPRLEHLGLGRGDESSEMREVRTRAARFAIGVMRPMGMAIDRLSAEDAVASGSILHEYFAEAKKADLFDMAALMSMPAED